MGALFRSFFGYFLTPAGVVLLGVLDSSLIFFLPLGLDFVVIILSARKPDLFWLYPLLATLGSVIGAAATFWIGRKAGQYTLSMFVRRSTLKKVEQRISQKGAVAIAALGAIPPPFPYTAFIVTSGACGVNPWTFLSTLAAVRLVRFGVEAGLGARYGSGIISWMESPTFMIVVVGLAVLAVAGTILSAVAVYRSAKHERQSRGEPGATET